MRCLKNTLLQCVVSAYVNTVVFSHTICKANTGFITLFTCFYHDPPADHRLLATCFCLEIIDGNYYLILTFGRNHKQFFKLSHF